MVWVQWPSAGYLAFLSRDIERLVAAYLQHPGHMELSAIPDPPIEVVDTPGAVVVKAQVPGVRTNDLQVEVTEAALTLKGARRDEAQQPTPHYVHREFHYGAFARVIPLPMAVDTEKATARLEAGILTVTVPKREPARAHAIPIQTHEVERMAQPFETARVLDPVQEASEESFPASDPPAWSGTTAAPTTLREHGPSKHEA